MRFFGYCRLNFLLPLLKQLWLPGLGLLLSFSVQAQKALKTGDAHFQRYEYMLALEAYKEAVAEQELSPALARKIAECYRYMNHYQAAETWYEQVVSLPGAEPADYFHYAEAARRNGHYQKAKELYLTYAELMPAEEQKAFGLIASCEKAQAWIANPEPYKLDRQSALSSAYNDFSPVYFQEGIVFTSDRPAAQKERKLSGWTGKPYPMLFYSKGQEESWSAPEALPAPINVQLQNGSAAFSPDQQTIFFTRVKQVRVRSKKINSDPFSWVKLDADNAGNKHVSRLGLYMATRKESGWSEPVAFPYNKESDYSVGHPALSPDGNLLYFVSDMPGGSGQTDIYVSQRQADGTWGKPLNLGGQINTPEKEMFPTVSPAGVLHYSSSGHPGMGGLDIFVAEGSPGNWQAVRNLRYPVNSPQDDFGMVFDKTGDAGLVASNRASTDGTDDIFSFQYQRIACRLAGQSVEKVQTRQGGYKSVPVANVQVRLYRPGDTTALVTYSDAAGHFTFPILDGLAYTLKASKPGYLVRSATINPDCRSIVDMVSLGLVLDRDVPNEPILVENIYYDLDEYQIRPDAQRELDKLVQTLKDNPHIRIELSSHTDSRQTHAYNQRLSQLRAEAAVNYIVSKGIDPSRLVARGYGETRLLNRCADNVPCSEAEHQLNRRTEFKLLTNK